MFAASVSADLPRIALDDLAYEPMASLGQPFAERGVALHYVITQRNGRPVLCTTASGRPALFSVFDLESGEVVKSFDIPVGETFWAHERDSQGRVYFAGYSAPNLYRYNPADDSLADLGRIGSAAAVYAIAVDESDNVCMATTPSSKLYKYDKGRNRIYDFGSRLSGENSLRSLVYHDGYLYGGGDTGNTRFIRIKTSSLTVNFLGIPNRNPQQETLPGPDIGAVRSYYYGKQSGGQLFFEVRPLDPEGNEGKGILCIFDPATQQWRPEKMQNYQGLVVSEPSNGKVYFPANHTIWSYDLDSRLFENTWIGLTVPFLGSGIVSLSEIPGFSEPSLVTMIYTGINLGLRNTVTKAYHQYAHPPRGSALATRTLAATDFGILAAAYIGIDGVLYNPVSEEIERRFPMGQAEGIASHGYKAWFGLYPQARLREMDFSQPTNDQNPRELFDLAENGQNRPFGLAASEKYLVMGTVPTESSRKGALSVYERDTGQLSVYPDIVPDQSLTSIVVSEDAAYAASGAWGGINTSPLPSVLDEGAQVILFDLKERQVKKRANVKIPGASKPAPTIGKLMLGPGNCLLWGVAYGSVFVMDAQSLKVLRTLTVENDDWSKVSRRWEGFNLQYDSFSGLVIANPNQTLVAIDPLTFRWKRLLPSDQDKQVSNFAVSSENGSIFLTMATSTPTLRVLRNVARQHFPELSIHDHFDAHPAGSSLHRSVTDSKAWYWTVSRTGSETAPEDLKIERRHGTSFAFLQRGKDYAGITFLRSADATWPVRLDSSARHKLSVDCLWMDTRALDVHQGMGILFNLASPDADLNVPGTQGYLLQVAPVDSADDTKVRWRLYQAANPDSPELLASGTHHFATSVYPPEGQRDDGEGLPETPIRIDLDWQGNDIRLSLGGSLLWESLSIRTFPGRLQPQNRDISGNTHILLQGKGARNFGISRVSLEKIRPISEQNP